MRERSTGEILMLAFAAVAVVVMLVLVSGVVVRSYTNSTGGMTPTLPIGVRLLVPRTREVRRGDIVVFRFPLAPDTTFVKRVVAIGGDTVEIRAKRLYVNGAEVREPYASHVDEVVYPKLESLPEPYRSRDQFGPVTVAPDQFFVLGDNRDESSDSRFWGTVPRAAMIGRVAVAASFSRGFWRPR